MKTTVQANLLESDDSDADVPDLNLPAPRRRFFNKDDSYDYSQRQSNWKKILLISALLVFLILIYFVYRASTMIRELSDEVKGLRAHVGEIHAIEESLKKLEMEFHLDSESRNGNGSKPITDFVYERLRNVTSIMENVTLDTKKASNDLEQVLQRVAKMEYKCLSICQAGFWKDETKEKDRRRQIQKVKNSTKKKIGDEIVFKRDE